MCSLRTGWGQRRNLRSISQASEMGCVDKEAINIMFCWVFPCTNLYCCMENKTPKCPLFPLGFNERLTYQLKVFSITPLKHEDWTHCLQVFAPAPYTSKILMLQEVSPTNFHIDIPSDAIGLGKVQDYIYSFNFMFSFLE